MRTPQEQARTKYTFSHWLSIYNGTHGTKYSPSKAPGALVDQFTTGMRKDPDFWHKTPQEPSRVCRDCSGVYQVPIAYESTIGVCKMCGNVRQVHRVL